MTRTSLIFAVTLATLGAFALFSSNGIAARDPVSLTELAPADEYFGRQRLSPLGIRHTIFSLKDDLHKARRRPDAIAHDADLVADAIDDWAQRFPHDSWLPATVWNLAILYEELPGSDARDRAVALLQELRDRFSDSPYAANATHDLARGVGVRAWPRWAGTPPPPPQIVAAASASATASATASASASVSASASASPAPSATPAPVSASDPDSLVRATRALGGSPQDQITQCLALEERFIALSRGGSDPAYARAAWELAATFERLPGDDAQTHAIKMLALLVDRYPSVVYGRWAMRDLKRGVGERSQQ